MLGKVRSWVGHFCPQVSRPQGGVRPSRLSPRIAGPSGPSGRFIRGSGISALGSFEVLTGASARGQLSDFVSISLTHFFRKEEGWAMPWLPLLGRVMVSVELQSDRFK
jgi:hypothetical protein